MVYYGKPRSFWMPAAAGGALGGRGVFVFEADLGQTFEVSETSKVSNDGWLVSDASWKALKSDAWSEDWKNPAEMHPLFGDTIPTEVVDAGRFPFGWEQPGFDDSAWGPSHIIPAGGLAGSGGRTRPPTDPYGPLHPRPIGKLGGDLRSPTAVRAETLAGQINTPSGDPVKRLQATLDLAVTGPAGDGDRLPLALDVPAAGCVRIMLDMGGIVMGQVQFEIEAPAGTVLDISYTEEPLAPPRGPFDGMHSGTRYVARGAHDRFKLYDALGFRYAYLLIHGVTGPVTLRSFRRARGSLPVAARRGIRVQR